MYKCVYMYMYMCDKHEQQAVNVIIRNWERVSSVYNNNVIYWVGVLIQFKLVL